MKFSIRTALIAILFISICCWALAQAGQASRLVLSAVALLAFMTVAVFAFVGSGKRRAVSVGYFVCSLTYGVLLMLPGHEPLNPYAYNGLPTTLAMQPLLKACRRVEYRDAASGKLLPNYTPKPNEQFINGHGGGDLFGGGGGFGPKISRTFTPNQTDFMMNAQMLWTIFFGIFGALLANHVYDADKSGTPGDVPAKHG